MNCRAIISPIKYLVIAVLAVNIAVSNSLAAAISWDIFQSQNLTIQSESTAAGDVYSTYPLWLQTIYTRWLNWEPRVKESDLDSPNCRLSFSSESLKVRVSEVSQLVQTRPDCVYLKDAENMSTLRKITRALSVNFDMADTNHFRKVMFKIPSQEVTKSIHVRGLLGMHDDKIKRPLVVLRMGVHGNVDEFLAERFLVKIIFEDFGFNFLALENLTSHGYLSMDNPITFGGVDEGLHTFYILNELHSGPLSSIISETHLMGVSLGAHGIFLTEAIDEINQNKIKSVTAFCPVINLVKTLSNQQNAQINFGIIDLWNYRRLQAVRNRVLELDPNDWWMTFFDFKPRYVPAILNYLEKHQTKPSVELPKNIKWPVGLLNHLETSKSFSALNDFWPYYENKKTPLLIVTTANDLLVSSELNTDLILQKKQLGNFANTEILQLTRSVHCGLATDYKWNFIVDLLKTQWGEPQKY